MVEVYATPDHASWGSWLASGWQCLGALTVTRISRRHSRSRFRHARRCIAPTVLLLRQVVFRDYRGTLGGRPPRGRQPQRRASIARA